jgi:uncharacterized membrane protein
VAGFVIGVIGLVVLAVLAPKACAGTPPALLKVALTAAIAVAAAVCALGVTQILVARRWVSLPRPAFKALVWGINHQAWHLALLTAAWVAVAVGAYLTARRQAITGPNPAIERLQRAARVRRRRYLIATGGLYLGLGWVATFGVAIDGREVELSPPEAYELVDGQAMVALENIDDGHLHRFAYTTSKGVEVRFIVVKKNGVAYGVGLDACEVCGPTGYYERDGKIVCRLCDVVMNVATIGYKGGCNPIPLEYQLDGEYLVVSAADLEAANDIFA